MPKTVQQRTNKKAKHALCVWFTEEEYAELNRYSHLRFRSKVQTVRKFVLEGIGLKEVVSDEPQIKCPFQS